MLLIVVELVFFGIIGAYAATFPGFGYAELIILFLALLFIVGPLGRIWLLRMTHYAVTDQRLIAVSGRFSKKSVSVQHDQITTIEVNEPWFAGKLFGIGSIVFSVPSFSYNTITWRNVKAVQETLNYINTARSMIAQYRTIRGGLTQASMVGGAVAGNLGQQKRCWNCKSPIASTARFCRICGAQQP